MRSTMCSRALRRRWQRDSLTTLFLDAQLLALSLFLSLVPFICWHSYSHTQTCRQVYVLVEMAESLHLRAFVSVLWVCEWLKNCSSEFDAFTSTFRSDKSLDTIIEKNGWCKNVIWKLKMHKHRKASPNCRANYNFVHWSNLTTLLRERNE